MVRSQVVSKLRSLCVSVLESDLDSRKQLESAVGTIAERLSQADSNTLEIEAERLSRQRADLQEKLARLRERLANARADEYRDVVVAGKSWSPSEAARWVVEGDKSVRLGTKSRRDRSGHARFGRGNHRTLFD